MRSLYRQMELLARCDLSVLILGETGVGKEHLAGTLHLSSQRHKGPFVAIHCAAIPAELLEAELFGIEKGVATGVDGRRGKIGEADGGTLFLDEIGDMPPAFQVKVLRVLQEKEVQPVGGKRRSIDVRVISATHSDLGRLLGSGGFRSDLYYRLAGYELWVPPLRQRREDIPALAAHFLQAAAQEAGWSTSRIDLPAPHELAARDWPGNVRQLENEVRRLALTGSLGRSALQAHREPPRTAAEPKRETSSLSLGEQRPPSQSAGAGLDLRTHVRRLERRLIRQALAQASSRKQAARLLGISRNTLATKLRQLGLLSENER